MTNFSFGDMQVNLSSTGRPAAGKANPQAPFRLLIMGDLTGRANQGVQEPLGTGRKPLRVDCDNFEQVLEKLSPKLTLALGGRDDCQLTLTLTFKELEDFHPDRLYEQVELFQALRKTRADLQNTSTFAAAAKEVQSWAGTAQADSPTGEAAPGSDQATAGGADAGDDDMFSRLLGQPKSDLSGPAQTAHSTVDAMIKQIVGPHIVPSPDPQQGALVAAVDQATSKQMREILHHPDFQALEAAWLSLDFLIRNIETDEQLQLYVLDVSKQELAADLTSSDHLASTGWYRLLVEQTIHTPGGEPWAAVIADYRFDATVPDAELLGRLAKISAEANTPWVAAADPHWVGCASLATHSDPRQWTDTLDEDVQQAWTALRGLQEATGIALTMPRFLLRLPYGRDTDPIDQFDFEEIDDATENHASFLWGRSSMLCALLLAQGYQRQGWAMTPGGGTIDGLPAHTYKHDGESQMTPCAEAWLTDRASDAIMDHGLIPVLSVKSRDAVQVTRIQSLARPAKNLAGRWG